VRVRDVFTALAQSAESGRQFDLILADRLTAKKISAAVRLPSRSNSSTTQFAEAARTADGLFSGTPNVTRFDSRAVARK